MSAYLRRHHIALVALFVALSGTTYAATQVTSRDIARDAVRAKQIRDDAVRSSEVLNEGLTGTDIDEDTLDTVPNARSAQTAISAAAAQNAADALRAANADRLDGFDSADFLNRNESVNADRLDGLDSSDFLRSNQPVEADTLEGKGASAFLQGQAVQGGLLPPANESRTGDLGDLDLSYMCPTDNLTTGGTLTLDNQSAATMIVMGYEGGAGAESYQLQPDGSSGETHSDTTTPPDDLTLYDITYFKDGVDYSGMLVVTSTHAFTLCEIGYRLVLYTFPG